MSSKKNQKKSSEILKVNNSLDKVDAAAGDKLRGAMQGNGLIPMVGVYDVFSASLVARYFPGIFLSGYGFTASHYGLPDAGYMTSGDIASFCARIRAILPDHHILADIDDGFGDADSASDTIVRLENAGASAVMIEDQKRPKKCGHLEGKQVVPLEEFVVKIHAVLHARRKLFILARTDATDIDAGIQRVSAFAETGIDAVMVEAVRDCDSIKRIRAKIPPEISLVINLIYGGKTRMMDQKTMEELGVNVVIYSTPCLYAAQKAIETTLSQLASNNLLLDERTPCVSLQENTNLLEENAKERFNK